MRAWNCAGGYICFVDSDDWLPKRSIEILQNKISESCADVVFGNWLTILVSGAKKRAVFSDAVVTMDDADALANCLPAVFAPWGALYRRDIIINNGIWFPLDMRINDDSFFVYKYLQKCKKIATVSESVYYYNHLNDISITGKAYAEHNACFARSLSERAKLFTGKALPPKEQRTILELFQVSLLSYVSGFQKVDAIPKLKETHEIFKPFLEVVLDEQVKQYNDMYAQLYFTIKQYLETGDYQKLYSVLLEIIEGQRQRRKFKDFVRKIVLKPEQFVVFRLNLLYK